MNLITSKVLDKNGNVRSVEASYDGITLKFKRGADGLPVQVSRTFPYFMRNIDFIFPNGVYAQILSQVHGIFSEKRKARDQQLALKLES